MTKLENDIMIYQDKDGVTKVNVKFIDEDIWLTQSGIASLYKTTQQDGKLQETSTHKNFLLVQILDYAKL